MPKKSKPSKTKGDMDDFTEDELSSMDLFWDSLPRRPAGESDTKKPGKFAVKHAVARVRDLKKTR